jgi:hypothetical protein
VRVALLLRDRSDTINPGDAWDPTRVRYVWRNGEARVARTDIADGGSVRLQLFGYSLEASVFGHGSSLFIQRDWPYAKSMCDGACGHCC